MKTFKEFTKKRKYVAAIYDKNSQKKLRDWCLENGFDLSVSYGNKIQRPEDFEFHTTIFYTTNEVNLKNQVSKQSPTEVTITGIKLLGENKDIPVLAISVSRELKVIRKRYEDLGLEDKWPTWIPHISISYAKEKRDIEDIKLPNFKPKFDAIVIEDIEE